MSSEIQGTDKHGPRHMARHNDGAGRVETSNVSVRQSHTTGIHGIGVSIDPCTFEVLHSKIMDLPEVRLMGICLRLNNSVSPGISKI